jgi:hypothetical protein
MTGDDYLMVIVIHWTPDNKYTCCRFWKQQEWQQFFE